MAHVAAAMPGASVHWPGGPAGALGALAASVAAVALLRASRGRRIVAAAVAGLLAARCTVLDRVAGWPPDGWLITACDVGQGDALVLRVGPGTGVLVDAGPEQQPLTACLRQLGIRRLPVVLLTHFHADHVDGLPAVVGHLPVGEILVGGLREPAEGYRLVRAAAAAAHVPLIQVGAGFTLTVGQVSLRVVGPLRTLRGTDSDPNNNSLVTVARAGGLTMLLAGDAEQAEQQELLDAGVIAAAAPHIDVLKVAHHGSASQEPGLLGRSGARVALISVGAGNTYGHPAPGTIDALARAGIRYARTDTDGAAAVVATAGRPVLVLRGHGA